VLINWQRQLVEVYRRENGKWIYQRYEPNEKVELASVQLTMPMNLIYANTTVPIRETPEQDELS
jgi:hypothetical protein